MTSTAASATESVESSMALSSNASSPHADTFSPPTSLPVAPFKKKTSFLDLPAELRNEIYTLALVLAPTFVLETREHTPVPALCQASRQVRFESLPVFYGQNNFIANSESGLCQFLSDLDDNRARMLTSVQFDCTAKNLKEAYHMLRFLVGFGGPDAGHQLPDEVAEILRMRIAVHPRCDRRGCEKVWVSLHELKEYAQISLNGCIFRANEIKWSLEKDSGGVCSVRGREKSPDAITSRKCKSCKAAEWIP